MGSVPFSPTPAKIWFPPCPVLPTLHFHLTALSPCTVAVWRSKVVPSLLIPPCIVPVIHGPSLHPPPPTDKLGDPCSSHGWTQPHTLFPSLPQDSHRTCCVNHPRLGAGKSSPSTADSCTKSSVVLHRST